MEVTVAGMKLTLDPGVAWPSKMKAIAAPMRWIQAIGVEGNTGRSGMEISAMISTVHLILEIQVIGVEVTVAPRSAMGTCKMGALAAPWPRIQAVVSKANQMMKTTFAQRKRTQAFEMKPVARRTGMRASKRKTVATSLEAVRRTVMKAGAIIADIQDTAAKEATEAIIAVHPMIKEKGVKDPYPLAKGGVSKAGIGAIAAHTMTTANVGIGATIAAEEATIVTMVATREADTVGKEKNIVVNDTGPREWIRVPPALPLLIVGAKALG